MCCKSDSHNLTLTPFTLSHRTCTEQGPSTSHTSDSAKSSTPLDPHFAFHMAAQAPPAAPSQHTAAPAVHLGPQVPGFRQQQPMDLDDLNMEAVASGAYGFGPEAAAADKAALEAQAALAAVEAYGDD